MKTNKDRRKYTGKKSKKVLGMLLGMVLVMSAVLALPATKLTTEAGYEKDGIKYGVGGSNGTDECKVVSSPDASGDIVILDNNLSESRVIISSTAGNEQ